MKKNLSLIILLATFAIVLSPTKTDAATVYLEASRNNISVGDTAIIAVKVNADGAIINTIDGEVALKPNANNVTVQEFSLANSAFGLWPRTPSLSKDGNLISFVGGVPGGFSIEGATLFNIIVEAKKEGKIKIIPQNISAFLNDGKGTKVPVTLKEFTLDVVAKKPEIAVQNDWSSLVAKDVISPEKFVIVLGKDEKMFDGKIFAFFSAVDNQSGISHYEVSENGQTAVRSGSTYVLKDQEGKTRLSVIAYDKAGNKREAVYGDGVGLLYGVSWGWVVIITIVLYFVVKIARLFRRSNKTNVSV